jgi:hypothetical protein
MRASYEMAEILTYERTGLAGRPTLAPNLGNVLSSYDRRSQSPATYVASTWELTGGFVSSDLSRATDR